MGNDVQREASKAIPQRRSTLSLRPLARWALVGADVAQQLWCESSARRRRADHAAVALYHKGGSVLPQPPVDILSTSPTCRVPHGAGIDQTTRDAGSARTDSSPRLLSAPNLVTRLLPHPDAVVDVHDIWSGVTHTQQRGRYVASRVPHRTAFLTLEW